MFHMITPVLKGPQPFLLNIVDAICTAVRPAGKPLFPQQLMDQSPRLTLKH